MYSHDSECSGSGEGNKAITEIDPSSAVNQCSLRAGWHRSSRRTTIEECSPCALVTMNQRTSCSRRHGSCPLGFLAHHEASLESLKYILHTISVFYIMYYILNILYIMLYSILYVRGQGTSRRTTRHRWRRTSAGTCGTRRCCRCVRACVCLCVRACVRACVRVCVEREGVGWGAREKVSGREKGSVRDRETERDRERDFCRQAYIGDNQEGD
jgi:hypothetical protein